MELATLARSATAAARCGPFVVELDQEPISGGFASLLGALGGYLAGWLGVP